jgi:hypothetical protein
MTVNELIKKLEELKGSDLDNGDLPVVIGLSGGTMPDDVDIEHYNGDPKLPFVRICSIKDDRIGPETFGRLS